MIAGCQSTPTQQDIDDHYEHRLDLLRIARDELWEKCEESSDPGACRQGLINWYTEVINRWNEMYNEATLNNLDHMHELEKQWEEKVRELIPSWPELDDLVLPFVNTGEVTVDIEGVPDPDSDPCRIIVEAMRKYNADFDAIDLTSDPTLNRLIRQSPCFGVRTTEFGQEYAETLESESLDVQGTISYEVDGVTITISIAGTLDIAGGPSQGGGYSANVFGGTLAATLSTGGSALLEVVPDDGNLLVADAAGLGDLTVLFDAAYSNEGWDAILQDLTRLRVPIMRNQSGAIQSAFGPGPITDIIPYKVHPLSDYNDDGVLDLATDMAAFQADLAAQAYLTDRNEDGSWNSDDLALWLNDFDADLAQQ